jgi:hypothetical protein
VDIHLSERSDGAFYRTIPLPPGVDTDKVEAKSEFGVLAVMLPKTACRDSRRSCPSPPAIVHLLVESRQAAEVDSQRRLTPRFCNNV